MPPADDAQPAAAAPAGGQLARWLGAAGSPRRRVATNALWTWGVFLAGALVAFFMARYLLTRLGDDAYGIWAVVLAITGYFGLADLGVRPAVVHYVAKHDALGDLPGLNRHVNAAFRIFAAGGLLLVLATLWFADHIRGTNLGSVPPGTASAVVLITGIELGLTLPFNAFTAVLIGRQRFDTVMRIDLALLAARTLALVAVVEAGHGLLGLAWVNAAVGVVEVAWKMGAAFRERPGLAFAPRSADAGTVRALLRYGGWAILISVALLLTWQTDPLVIKEFLSPAHVSHFALPATLTFYARGLLWAACRALAPAAGALAARGDRAALTALLAGSTRTLLLLAAPAVAYMLVVGDAFLAAWLTDGFRGESGEVLRVMALALVPAVASQPLIQVLYGVNRLRQLAVLTLAEGLANLLLSVLLVRTHGIVGVAWGTALPALVVHLVVLPAWLARETGLSWGTFLRRALGVPLLAGAAAAGALRLVTPPDAALGWPGLVLRMLLALAAAALVGGAALRLAARRPAEARA